MSAVHEWVSSLLEVGKSLPPFFLYTTPPPTVIARADTTIADAHMVPAVVLYLGWGESPTRRTELSAGGISATEYLCSEALRTAQAASSAGFATGSSAAVVGQSVELRSLGEELLVPASSAPGGAAAGAKRSAVSEIATSDDMMEAMAARLLGGGGSAQAGRPLTQAGGSAVTTGPRRFGSNIPAWLQTGGSGK